MSVKFAKRPQFLVPSCRGMFPQGHVSKQSDMLVINYIRVVIIALPDFAWWLMVVITNYKLGYQ